MATLLLAAAGSAVGSVFGGSVLGMSGAVIGRALGATVGRLIDQRIIGLGAEPVEMGRVDRFRLMGAGEGTAIARAWGRVRLGGQVIWASRFEEHAQKSGGKGSSGPSTRSYSYTVSVAIALCEGEITRVGRIWADGNEIAPDGLNLRLYRGTEDQEPDAKIEAVEGADNAPAYRGLAYVVIEDLDLSRFGNRVPQFSFEVVRPAAGDLAQALPDLSGIVPGVCLVPGTGEYALATTPVHYDLGLGATKSANVHTASEITDFSWSLRQLREEMPGAGNVSVVVSWFGDDLRAGRCQIRPRVEQALNEGAEMPWKVSGLTRATAGAVPQTGGSSVYGGTPTDQSVIEAITAARAAGLKVTFYPFLLMEQLAGNGLTDPWTGAADQPALPWRGRITLEAAPGQPLSPDGTAAAATEVASFFGSAAAANAVAGTGTVGYSGPAEWSYRRFILHYARLCALAGGVDSFCIGSEMRGLTQIRGSANSFPAVQALKTLAADVRAILGASVKIGYAADWSEYFGYHTGGDVFFHLDPLWSDANIDFIGIDNYMPLADWRDGTAHADAAWGTAANPDYLRANIAGGEGFDWYYDDPNGIEAQRRLPITDAGEGEPWVFRYKDLVGWWSNAHHDRIGGVRQVAATAWVPYSKPIRFTEFGCAAIDKGANEPNRFLDPKSSESGLPRYSSGRRDDAMQLAYFQAMHRHWTDTATNPVSPVYGAAMVDFANSAAWSWDARPFPVFPGDSSLWTDATNYETGHWLNGRAAGQSLGAVLGEVCQGAGLPAPELVGLSGVVRGYAVTDLASDRSILQPLLMAHGAESFERDGLLTLRPRAGQSVTALDEGRLALSGEIDGRLEQVRASATDAIDRVRLTYMEADGDFLTRVADAAVPVSGPEKSSETEVPLALTRAEAVDIAERWLAETHLARDSARFALPPSSRALGPGDLVTLKGTTWRIDRVEQGDLRLVEAVRVAPETYRPGSAVTETRRWTPFVAQGPVYPLFLDLPLLSGAEVDHAPFVGAAATPWPGPVAVWSSATLDGFAQNITLEAPMVVGLTETALAAAPAGRIDRGPALRVRIEGASLSSAQMASLLAGANTAAIGDGSGANWEVFQFATATLVAEKTYELSLRLRGQAGTDGVMPSVWPAGSTLVLFTSALKQIDLPLAARGLVRNYRIGAAAKGVDSPLAIARAEAFDGVGLRPYRPAHLRATAAGGDRALSWIRRTRIDGDSWQSLEVPLGEETESYLVRVLDGATERRAVTLATPAWIWTAAMQAADFPTGGTARIEVAQLSQRFGPGPAAALQLAL